MIVQLNLIYERFISPIIFHSLRTTKYSDNHPADQFGLRAICKSALLSRLGLQAAGSTEYSEKRMGIDTNCQNE
jgi:hypothetical protein